MSSSNKFCPDCSTLLHPIEKFNKLDSKESDDEEELEDGLYLKCGDCSYSEKAPTFSTTHFSKRGENEQNSHVHPKRISLDYMFDMTYPRTKSKPCANSECPSRGEDNPEIVLITNGEHPEIAYLCTVCKYIWGKL